MGIREDAIALAGELDGVSFKENCEACLASGTELCRGDLECAESVHKACAKRLREIVGKDAEDDTTVSVYDLLPDEDRKALAWVRENGGLERVRDLLNWVIGHCSTRQQLDFDFWLSGRVMHELGFEEDVADRDEVERRLLARLMPEGMEWPRFDDGEPVAFRETGLDVYGAQRRVEGVKFTQGGFTFISDGMGRTWWGNDKGPMEDASADTSKRVERPEFQKSRKVADSLTSYSPASDAPKVLDADGVEIRVGDTVYGFAGQQYEVTGLCEHEPSIVHAKTVGDGVAADELLALSGQLNSAQLEASKLTHEQPDTWERLEEDAHLSLDEYCKKYETKIGHPLLSADMRIDLVRRAKALAERERGERKDGQCTIG